MNFQGVGEIFCVLKNKNQINPLKSMGAFSTRCYEHEIFLESKLSDKTSHSYHHLHTEGHHTLQGNKPRNKQSATPNIQLIREQYFPHLICTKPKINVNNNKISILYDYFAKNDYICTIDYS